MKECNLLICSKEYGGCGYVGKAEKWKSGFASAADVSPEADIILCPKCQDDHALTLTEDNLRDNLQTKDAEAIKKELYGDLLWQAFRRKYITWQELEPNQQNEIVLEAKTEVDSHAMSVTGESAIDPRTYCCCPECKGSLYPENIWELIYDDGNILNEMPKVGSVIMGWGGITAKKTNKGWITRLFWQRRDEWKAASTKVELDHGLVCFLDKKPGPYHTRENIRITKINRKSVCGEITTDTE